MNLCALILYMRTYLCAQPWTGRDDVVTCSYPAGVASRFMDQWNLDA